MADAPEYEKKIALLAPELARRGIRHIPSYILVMPNVPGDEEFCEMVNLLGRQGQIERGY